MPHKIAQFVTILILITAIAGADAQAQGIPAASVVPSPFGEVGARGMAFGNATISDPNDISIMYTNPAGLTFVDHRSVFLDIRQNPGPRSYSSTISAPILLNSARALGIGVSYSQAPGSLFGTDTIPGTVKFYQMDAAFAANLSYSLSLGVRIGSRYSLDERTKQWLGYGSVGLYYQPEPSISYALVYNGLSRVFHTVSDPAQILPNGELQKSFEIGLSLRYPFSMQYRLFTLSVANEKIVHQSGLLYKGGIEIYPLPFVDLRAGFVITPNTSDGRFGFGLAFSRVHLNYAIQPARSHGPIHQLSLLIEP